MDVAVTGSTGLIGSALCEALELRGDRPVRLLRRPPSSRDEIQWDPEGDLDPSSLAGIDAVVHLAGAGIADRRWTRAQRRLILESRSGGTACIARAMAEARDARASAPAVLVSGSAIGIYGDRGDTEIDETSGPGSGFLADVCAAWEAATTPAAEAGVRVAVARTGIVLSADRGLLARQLPVFRLGLGGRLGSGRQPMSWIALADEVAALLWLLDNPVAGPVNLTAPQPVTNAEFATALGAAVGRPARLPVPAAAPMAWFGVDLVRELMLSGARVRPSVLLGSGFEFGHPDLDGALRASVSRR